ncbi:hypothetical protein BSZ25_19380 [Bradyrhizobium canariense]|nr:hypothetical protein BSZ25_19380 [Bradyrhizobium canariense]OSI92669.1 hypothetical protein BSZ24_14385 [Bradyrhizobium canariense]OSJ08254.1 hypothetical protein BSZ16_07585 [Bradyrhizobium canariense]
MRLQSCELVIVRLLSKIWRRSRIPRLPHSVRAAALSSSLLTEHDRAEPQRRVLDVEPEQIFAGESTDGSENVASRSCPLFQFQNGLWTAFFQCHSDPQPIRDRDVVANVRPDGPCVRAEGLSLNVGRIAFEQPQAVALQRVCHEGDLFIAAPGASLTRPQEKTAIATVQYDFAHRKTGPLRFGVLIMDGTDGRIERGLLKSVAEKRPVHGNR